MKKTVSLDPVVGMKFSQILSFHSNLCSKCIQSGAFPANISKISLFSFVSEKSEAIVQSALYRNIQCDERIYSKPILIYNS